MSVDCNREGVTRRSYLATAGALGVGSTAGCLGFLIAENDEDVQMVDEQEVAVGPDRHDAFGPELVHITEGGTVTFNWQSGNHDVTSFHLANDVPEGTPEGTTPFSENLAGPGEQLVVDFDETGVYNILCVRHERVGMMMTVVVGRPDDLDDQPALAEPDERLSDATQEKWRELAAEVRELLEGETDD